MGKPRLLAIDESFGLSEAVQAIAEAGGYEARIVGGSREFTKLYPSVRPDVAIFTLVMEEMDGLEVLGWLSKQTGSFRATVITRPDSPYRDSAKALVDASPGMDVAFVSRSLDEGIFRKDLAEAVAALLRRAGSPGGESQAKAG